MSVINDSDFVSALSMLSHLWVQGYSFVLLSYIEYKHHIFTYMSGDCEALFQPRSRLKYYISNPKWSNMERQSVSYVYEKWIPSFKGKKMLKIGSIRTQKFPLTIKF